MNKFNKIINILILKVSLFLIPVSSMQRVEINWDQENDQDNLFSGTILTCVIDTLSYFLTDPSEPTEKKDFYNIDKTLFKSDENNNLPTNAFKTIKDSSNTEEEEEEEETKRINYIPSHSEQLTTILLDIQKNHENFYNHQKFLEEFATTINTASNQEKELFINILCTLINSSTKPNALIVELFENFTTTTGQETEQLILQKLYFFSVLITSTENNEYAHATLNFITTIDNLENPLLHTNVLALLVLLLEKNKFITIDIYFLQRVLTINQTTSDPAILSIINIIEKLIHNTTIRKIGKIVCTNYQTTTNELITQKIENLNNSIKSIEEEENFIIIDTTKTTQSSKKNQSYDPFNIFSAFF